MELSNISTVVRPRSKWQAVDLGFKMASKWYGPLISGWLMVALPVFLVLHLVFLDYSWLAMLVFWWLKPLFERIQLGYLSFAQFGEDSTLKQQFKRWLSVVGRQWLATLLWRRFSLQRSYAAPVVQLENLAGTRRRKRLQLFDGDNQQAAFWLTIVLMHIEFFITLAVYALVIFLIPAQADIELDFFEMIETVTIANNILVFLSMALVAPYFVGAGFALYLNQRTQIEGWDIEITFRRMVERQQAKRKGASTLASLLCVLMLCGVALPGDTIANEQTEQDIAQSAEAPIVKIVKASPETQKAYDLAQEIMTDEHFNQKTTANYPEFFLDMKFDDKSSQKVDMPEWLSSLLRFFAGSVELLLTALVLTIVALLLYRYRDWLLQFAPSKQNRSTASEPPTSVFGLDIDQDSMPDDPAAHAKTLWQQGDKRQALSLLYRGSLLKLVTQNHLEVHDSFTEGECVAQVKQNAQPDTAEYFELLTKNWQRLAYASIMPEEDIMNRLFDQWHQVFAEVSDE
ncbi:MAG: hypothetical protein HRT35_07415 [Algicola sp.]|nr:hypothetical protein [Algicola sp.]